MSIFCQVGGFLAEMKTTSQLELLSGLAGMEEQFTGIQNWWIGLSDLGHEGTWVWVHSFQVETNRDIEHLNIFLSGSKRDVLVFWQSQ